MKVCQKDLYLTGGKFQKTAKAYHTNDKKKPLFPALFLTSFCTSEHRQGQKNLQLLQLQPKTLIINRLENKTNNKREAFAKGDQWQDHSSSMTTQKLTYHNPIVNPCAQTRQINVIKGSVDCWHKASLTKPKLRF